MSLEVILPPPDFQSYPLYLIHRLEKVQKALLPTKNYRQPIIFIAGPTGVGKTALSFQLAQKLNIEIVSADSVQVYCGMDIGTAKVSPLGRALIPHHLIDIRRVRDSFNVADFYYEAQAAFREITAKGKTPIVVGGTGFYFNALLYGIPDSPPSIPEVRYTLEKEMELHGVEAMFQLLCEKDPVYAATISVGDRQKIIRALEIMEITGRKVSATSWRNRLHL